MRFELWRTRRETVEINKVNKINSCRASPGLMCYLPFSYFLNQFEVFIWYELQVYQCCFEKTTDTFARRQTRKKLMKKILYYTLFIYSFFFYKNLFWELYVFKNLFSVILDSRRALQAWCVTYHSATFWINSKCLTDMTSISTVLSARHTWPEGKLGKN